jgi:hypothetical protein
MRGMNERTRMFTSAGPNWTLVSDRRLQTNLRDVAQTQSAALSRKFTLRAQQLAYCTTAVSPYERYIVVTRRPPS